MRQRKSKSQIDCYRTVRPARGAQLAEFGPALALLVGIVLIPLLDLVIVPVRWMLAQDLISDYSRQLALCETFSESQKKLTADPSLESRLQSIGGISVKSIDMYLKIRPAKSSNAGEGILVRSPGDFPAQWLPNGSNSPCLYSLELQIDSMMAPVILFPKVGPSIPGLTDPIPFLISASHEWENLGRDPNNKKFYMAE